MNLPVATNEGHGHVQRHRIDATGAASQRSGVTKDKSHEFVDPENAQAPFENEEERKFLFEELKCCENDALELDALSLGLL